MRTLSVPLMTPHHHIPCLGGPLFLPHRAAPTPQCHAPSPSLISSLPVPTNPTLHSGSHSQPPAPALSCFPSLFMSLARLLPVARLCGAWCMIYCTEPMSDDFCTGPLQGSSGPGELAPALHPTPPPASALLPGLAEGQLQPLTSLLMPPRGDTSLSQLKCCYSCLQEQSHKHANGFPLPYLGWQGHPTSPYVLL